MKIALLGDIAFLGNFSINKNPQIVEFLNPLSSYLSKFDLVIGNLETPFSRKKKTWGSKSSYICADVENIQILKDLHIDAVTLANNHMFDFGQEGFETTINVLDNAGIKWFGANGKEYRVEYGNNKIAFNGVCCYSTNPLNLSTKYGEIGINRFNVPETLDILQSNHKNGWLNIIAVHSGIEHVNRPSIDQIKTSRIIGDNVPFIWYGHHPHVVQGIEEYKDSLIAHSLGNFCFAGNTKDKNRPTVELSENNRLGMILEVEIENNKIKAWKATAIHIGENGVIDIVDQDFLIKKYSSFLKEALTDQSNYQKARLTQRNSYLEKRKEMRNLTWILKRLRPRYIKLFLNNKKNTKKYYQNVKQFLK